MQLSHAHTRAHNLTNTCTYCQRSSGDFDDEEVFGSKIARVEGCEGSPQYVQDHLRSLVGNVREYSRQQTTYIHTIYTCARHFLPSKGIHTYTCIRNIHACTSYLLPTCST